MKNDENFHFFLKMFFLKCFHIWPQKSIPSIYKIIWAIFGPVLAKFMILSNYVIDFQWPYPGPY